MTEVNICGLATLDKTIEDFQPDVVVSALRFYPPSLIRSKVVKARWHTNIDDIYLREMAGYKEAIRGVLDLEEERILIHCRHGQSRSAALAIAKIYQGNPDGVTQFLEDHPEAEPNPLILLFADEILEADGDLLRRCKDRYKGRNL